MKKRHSTGAAGLIAVLLTGSTAAQTQVEIPGAMGAFLDAWVNGRTIEALSYFSTSDQAVQLAHRLEPALFASSRPAGAALAAQDDDLRLGYWGIMNSVWRSPRYDGETRTYEQQPGRAFGDDPNLEPMSLEHIEKEVADLLAEEFETQAWVGGDGTFVAFVANEAMLITFADAEAVEVLLGGGRLTLGMLVGVVGPEGAPGPGPFAAFWQQEVDEWHIQTIGALQQ